MFGETQEEVLDPFSREFAAALFAAHPDWRTLARTEVAADESRYLVVEVPAPSGTDLAQALWIHTDAEEVTIGLDHHHAHFEWPPRTGRSPLSFIDDLIAERWMITTGLRDDGWVCWSSSGPAKEDIETLGQIATRIRVRSWKGSLDRDVLVADL